MQKSGLIGIIIQTNSKVLTYGETAGFCYGLTAGENQLGIKEIFGAINAYWLV